MHGPIDTPKEQREFNRAMNRLLWGVRIGAPVMMRMTSQ